MAKNNKKMRKRKELEDEYNISKKIDLYRSIIDEEDTRKMVMYLRENKKAKRSVIRFISDDIDDLVEQLKQRGVED